MIADAAHAGCTLEILLANGLKVAAIGRLVRHLPCLPSCATDALRHNRHRLPLLLKFQVTI
jgi:hypothetical protein